MPVASIQLAFEILLRVTVMRKQAPPALEQNKALRLVEVEATIQEQRF